MNKITLSQHNKLGINLKKIRLLFIENKQYEELKTIDQVRNILDDLESFQYPNKIRIGSYYGEVKNGKGTKM